MCIWAKSQRRRKASVWENSSSVSPGKPQIRSVVMAGRRKYCRSRVHRPEEPGGVIPAIHAPQGGRRSRIAWTGGTGGRGWGSRGGPAAEILRHGAGLQAAQPQAHLSGAAGAHRLQQVDEAAAVLEILSPRGDLDAGEDHLPVALLAAAAPSGAPPPPAAGTAPAPGHRG